MKYLKTICFTAFFLSGLASIVYELTWIRLLRNIFGSDSLAFSSLLTIFIGGIASGTYISGKLIKKYFSAPENASTDLIEKIDRSKSYFFILIYGAIELTVGLYALVTPLLLSESSLGNLWLGLNSLFAEDIVLLSLSKFFIAGFVLIIPTLLLGLSYPVLVELVTSNEAKSSSKYKLGSSNLYATNTLGSIFGSLIGGFLLIPNFGLKTSILIATLINFFIAFLIYLLKTSNKNLLAEIKFKEAWEFIKANAHEIKLQAQEKFKKGHQFWILVIIGVILGFSNLGLEVIWNKVFALIIGSSVFSATIVISVVLAGISFGAYSLNYFSSKIEDKDLDTFLSIVITGFAFLIFLSSILLNNCPWFFLETNEILTALFQDQAWLFSNFSKYLTVSSIIFPVTFLEGLAYAIVLYKASEISKAKQDPVGSRIAIISYWNTLGAIAGSFSAGFILIPFFSQFGSGISNSIRFILVLAFITAILSLFTKDRKEKKICITLLAIAAIATAFFLPSLAKNTLNSGTEIYKASKFKNISKKKFKELVSENEKLLFYKEGLNNIVTVVEDEAANAILLKNDGKVEAGIPLREDFPSKADTVTQTLLGIIPVSLKPESKNALVIGMGSGKTVENLAVAGKARKLKEITVCELEKEVYTAATRFFKNKFPIKVKKKTIDARNFLNSSKESFDLIVSQPSDPWLSGALFTREFWYKAKSKLTEQGLFFQWLQLYALDEDHLKIALKTFQEVFPQTFVFRSPHSAELILLGSENLNYLDIKEIERTIFTNEVRERLLKIGITDAADLMASLVLTPKDIQEIIGVKIGKKEIFSTDDNMSLELHTSKNIDNFFESVQTNSQYLQKLSKTINLYDFFASFEEYNFLSKLSMAHQKLVAPIHKQIARRLAEILHTNRPSPLTHLAFYEIYQANDEFERAESMLYEASRKYQDSVTQFKNQSLVFEDLHESFHPDFDQNLALYKVFLRYEDFNSAKKMQRLLNKQVLKQEKAIRKILKAEIFYEKAQAQLANLRVNPDYREINKVSENIKRARREDPLNYEYIKIQAELNMKRAQLEQEEHNQYTEMALENYQELNHIYPLDYESHEAIAEIYYKQLPKSRMKFMAKTKDESFENKFMTTLDYLKNSISLNPRAYKTNLYLADLQYKLGKPDLSYKYLKRLESLCQDESKCLAELGNENKILFDKLSETVYKLVQS